MNIQDTFRNRIIFAVLGFGLGGAIWGLEAYRGTVGAEESFTNPFSYILGAAALAVFGGLALSLSRGLFLSRRTLKIIGLGLVGWLVAFALPTVWAYKLFLFGGILAYPLFGIAYVLDKVGWAMRASTSYADFFLDQFNHLTQIDPSLSIGGLWLEFLLTGMIIGFVYSLIFKDAKIVKTVLWSAGGFAVAALVGPILGNLIGNLFNVLFVNYILTFIIICVIFSVCLTVGTRRKQAGISAET